MKKVIKANGDITFVNEKYLQGVLMEGDVVDENYVVDKIPPTITAEDILTKRAQARLDAAT